MADAVRAQINRALVRTIGYELRRPQPAPAPKQVAHKPPAKKPPAPKVAILVVNGFFRRGENTDYYANEAREFPWIELCLRQLSRHTRVPYTVLVWDNSFLPEHRAILDADPHVRAFRSADETVDVRHGRALDRLVGRLPSGIDYVVTLDTDSFPVRDGWLENLIGRLDGGARLAGV